MYGVTLKANIDAFSNAPPLIALRISKKLKFLVDTVAPGTVILAPSLNINKATNVNPIFFSKSLFFGLYNCLMIFKLNHLSFSTHFFY